MVIDRIGKHVFLGERNLYQFASGAKANRDG